MPKIPPEAKRVFEGVMFDVWQWEQKMFDGSVSTFERASREHTVIALPVKNNKIAVTRQMQPGWDKWRYDYVGGRLDDGEEPLIGAQRELLEEGGMVSDDWKLIEKLPKSTHICWDVYYFLARDARVVEEQELDNGEKIDIQRLTFDEMVELIQKDVLYDIPLKAKLMTMKVEGRLDEFRRLIFPGS